MPLVRLATFAPSAPICRCAHIGNLRECRGRGHLAELAASRMILQHAPPFFRTRFTPEQESCVKSQIETAVVETLLAVRLKLKKRGASRVSQPLQRVGVALLRFFRDARPSRVVERSAAKWFHRFNLLFTALVGRGHAGRRLPPSTPLHGNTKYCANLPIQIYGTKARKSHIQPETVRICKKAGAGASGRQNVCDSAQIRAARHSRCAKLCPRHAGQLSSDDVRQLMTAEEELNRLPWRYARILPARDMHRDVLKFFSVSNDSNYYYWLYSAWEFKYGQNRSAGIECLRRLAAKKFHLASV